MATDRVARIRYDALRDFDAVFDLTNRLCTVRSAQREVLNRCLKYWQANGIWPSEDDVMKLINTAETTAIGYDID